MDRDKALDMALGQIKKQYGEGAIMRMDEQAKVKVATIPTGALSLDLALGIGGLPRGRVVEIYGPESSGKTSVGLHVIAEAQKMGGTAAFIDAEHALDPAYAQAIGVNLEDLLVSQPDTGEQALEIADMLVRSGAVDVIVVDSVAALTPRAEIEGEMGDTHVGLQARLMSQALRKLAANLNKSRTCAVFINQLREKVGVLFGCFSHSTRVTLADGSQEMIGKIVNQRRPVEVLSYDPELGRVVPRRVTNWFNNGPTEHFLTFTVARGGGNGKARFSCTPNHKVRTSGGWREAQELRVGDRVLQAVPHYLSDFQWEVILGGLMGDDAVSHTRSGNGARFRLGHGAKQAAYADWKASLFANVGVSRSTNERGAVFHDVRPLPELAELRRAVYMGDKKVLSWDYLKRLTPLSLAIWYMDDAGFQIRSQGPTYRTQGGTGRADICVEALEPTSRTRLAHHLRDEWDIDSKLGDRAGKAVLQFSTEATDRLQALIAPYVHPSMEHKLLPRHQGQFAVEPTLGEKRMELMPMPILDIHDKPARQDGRQAHRYDIEVEGTHNYFVDGVMVHNSPETTPGGRALKFYSSVRLDVRRIESLKDGTDFVGNRVRVKVVKNKCVAEGTRVFDPTTGTTHTIEDIVESGRLHAAWAADKNGQMHVRPVVATFDQGEQEVIGLRIGDQTLRVTPDHLVLTEAGWREAGDLRPGDRVARPLRAGSFGDHEPLSVAEARELGRAIGEATSRQQPSIRVERLPELARDNADRPGSEWRLPAAICSPTVSSAVAGAAISGLCESAAGWLNHRYSTGIECGVRSHSEQLAWQVHWLLLRWGIPSTVAPSMPGVDSSKAPGRKWQLTVRGSENIRRFSEAIPMSGPRGKALLDELGTPQRHSGSAAALLSRAHTEPVLAWLRQHGVTASAAARIVGSGSPVAGLPGVLGKQRLRRDRVERLADALDSDFLREVVADDLYFEQITEILPAGRARTFDIEVEELHNFVADGVVVHNCAAPFRQAEFDILFGEGISKEGSILDLGVEHAIVKKAGAWYTYDGEQLGQGRENARGFLKEHADVADEIYKRVLEAAGLVPTDVVGEGPVDDEE